VDGLLQAIDPAATARFLGLAPPSPPEEHDLLLPLSRLGRPLLNRLVHPASRRLGFGRVLYRSRVRRALPTGRCPILVRVDDYPRADLPTRCFFEFADAFAARGIQMLLGVTPLLRRGNAVGLTDAEVRWLADAEAAGRVRLATHGTTHENLTPGMGRHETTELIGVHPDRLRLSLSTGLTAFARAGLPRPLHYIPPFNSLDATAYHVLAAEYRFVHGGPLSITRLAPLSPGVALDGAIYLPSYRPLYRRARELVSVVERATSGEPPHDLVCPLILTLHWAWEQADGMESARRLARVLDGRTARWQELEARAGAPAPETRAVRIG
jgi:hypothetical protein